ncbi:serine/threonine protein kinase [Methanocaldococcus sp.]
MITITRWLEIEEMIFKKIPKCIVNKKILEKLKDRGVEITDVLGKGHRGIVFKGRFKDKDVAIKIPRVDSPKNTIIHEAEVLRRIESYQISPRVYDYDSDYLIMDYIDGEELKSAISKLDDKSLLKVVEDILKISIKLDTLGVEHGEIQGGRHFLIEGKRTYIIDFDKARIKKTTKNFTEAVSLLFGGGRIASTVKDRLNLTSEDIEFLMSIAKIYKKYG